MGTEQALIIDVLKTKTWHSAKSMAQHPHFYTLHDDWGDDKAGFFVAVEGIREFGQESVFYGTPIIAVDDGEFRYWSVGRSIKHVRFINRARINYAEFSIEYGRHKLGMKRDGTPDGIYAQMMANLSRESKQIQTVKLVDDYHIEMSLKEHDRFIEKEKKLFTVVLQQCEMDARLIFLSNVCLYEDQIFKIFGKTKIGMSAATKLKQEAVSTGQLPWRLLLTIFYAIRLGLLNVKPPDIFGIVPSWHVRNILPESFRETERSTLKLMSFLFGAATIQRIRYEFY